MRDASKAPFASIPRRPEDHSWTWATCFCGFEIGSIDTCRDARTEIKPPTWIGIAILTDS
jgi:hypothetical protein